MNENFSTIDVLSSMVLPALLPVSGDQDLSVDGVLAVLGGLCTPGSEAQHKVCSIIRSLNLIFLFFQDLPLKEVLILHILGI